MNKEQEKFFITEEFYLTNVEDKKNYRLENTTVTIVSIWNHHWMLNSVIESMMKN